MKKKRPKIKKFYNIPFFGSMEIHAPIPCYVNGAADWLTANIKGADMWEWGCGASTLFYARLAGHVISVEHSPVWHFLIERELKVLGLDEKVDFFQPQNVLACLTS